MPRWTRNSTTAMGLDEDNFVKCLMAALTNTEVITTLQDILCKKVEDTVCSKLLDEITGLKTMLSEKDNKIDSLCAQVTVLEKKYDDLEQYSRRNSLRIFGIPEDTGGENIDEKIMTLINQDLEVTPPLTPDKIDRVHRIGPLHSSSRHGPRPVILKLTSFQTRQRIFRKRSSLRKKGSKVFINEDLTQMRSQLLFKARQLKKSGVISDCWSYNGQILVKNNREEISSIKDTLQLEKIKR